MAYEGNGTGTAVVPSGSDTEILAASPAYILASYIIDTLRYMTDYNDGSAWPLYISSLPDGDDIQNNAGGIYDTTGLLDGKDMRDSVVVEHHGIQIKIRSIDQQTGWTKMRQIVGDLDQVQMQEITANDITYEMASISRTSPIACIGTDEKRRFLFTVNFLATIREL